MCVADHARATCGNTVWSFVALYLPLVTFRARLEFAGKFVLEIPGTLLRTPAAELVP